MSEYRRFVSYIYAYNQEKKDKNVGFAKVEVREGKLKVNIQLGGLTKESEGLDVYGFVRKAEKLYGIWLGEIKAGPQKLFYYEGDPQNLQDSGYMLNALSGLWVKGNRGENYITVWDDDPIESMELEVEVQMLVETAEKVEEVSEAVNESDDELVESTEDTVEMEAEMIVEVLEETVAEQAVEEAVEAASIKTLNGVRAKENEDIFTTSDVKNAETYVENIVEEEKTCGYEQNLADLSAVCPQRIPFAADEVKECIEITPRELVMFQNQKWNIRKNNFVLHGYYQFRHLLFGCFADGTYFLGVPGFWNPRERQRAVTFGFPVFKESKEQHWNGRFGYWCRPLE